MSKKKKQSIHYVNNKEFSNAVVEYVKECDEARNMGDDLPIVPDYIARCFLKIAEGLSHKSNFIRYTYREEMVMDAVENCLKAIQNYNIDAATRTGTPNAFAYFTQISWYAFLRRIAKEKKQHDVRERYLVEAGVEAFISSSDVNDNNVIQHFVDELRDRIDHVKTTDHAVKEIVRKEKTRKRKSKISDSDLTTFMGDYDE